MTLALGLTLGALVACTPTETGTMEGPASSLRTPGPAVAEQVVEPIPRTLANGIVVVDLSLGSGMIAQKGRRVVLGYVGSTVEGGEFASSKAKGEPFTFTLGEGFVNPMWDVGIDGMRTGGVRRIWVPPELINGGQGRAGVIPPGVTVVFDVELLDVR